MHTADTWPIAAKMNFDNMTDDGIPLVESPAVWTDHIQQVADLGYTCIDPIDDWLPVADLSPSQFATLQDVLRRYDLQVPAMSLGRSSVVHHERGDRNLAMMHRALDRAAELGAKVLNFSFAQELKQAQLDALWFWHAQGHIDDPELRPLAIERVRELADHAVRNDMELSIEIYEDSYAGGAEEAVQLIKDIDHPSVGLNPDFGNLIRLHRPIEKYQSMFEIALPYANYWHIKNYLRDEDPSTGAYFSAPASLATGLIDYRSVIRWAVTKGYRGAFQTEHYGGDWLTMGALNRDYIRVILRSVVKDSECVSEVASE